MEGVNFHNYLWFFVFLSIFLSASKGCVCNLAGICLKFMFICVYS